MKTVTIDGEEYEILGFDVNAYPNLEMGTVLIKVLPKQAEKQEYYLKFTESSKLSDFTGVHEYLDLTPTTANKIAEAVESLLKHIQSDMSDDVIDKTYPGLIHKVNQARAAYMEEK